MSSLQEEIERVKQTVNALVIKMPEIQLTREYQLYTIAKLDATAIDLQEDHLEKMEDTAQKLKDFFQIVEYAHLFTNDIQKVWWEILLIKQTLMKAGVACFVDAPDFSTLFEIVEKAEIEIESETDQIKKIQLINITLETYKTTIRGLISIQEEDKLLIQGFSSYKKKVEEKLQLQKELAQLYEKIEQTEKLHEEAALFYKECSLFKTFATLAIALVQQKETIEVMQKALQ